MKVKSTSSFKIDLYDVSIGQDVLKTNFLWPLLHTGAPNVCRRKLTKNLLVNLQTEVLDRLALS